PDIFGIYQTDPGPWGWEEPAFQAINGEYIWYPSTETYLDGLMIAKDLYDRGIIWKDNVIDTGGTMYSELYRAGQMGAVQARPMSNVNKSNRDAMLEINPDLDREMCWRPAYVSNPGNPDMFWSKTATCFWSCIGLSARVSDSLMIRFLDYQEWLHSDEGKDICGYYGLEGKDFTRAADGTITLNWQINQDTGSPVDPYASYRGFFRQLAMLDGIDPVRNLVTMSSSDVQTYNDHMDFYIQRLDTIKAVDYIQVYTSLPTKDRLGTFVQEVKAKAIDMLANADANTMRDEWTAWVATMLPKVQPVLDEMNALPYIPDTPENMYEFVRNGGIQN
ncbi:MAG: hypothetical protein FWH01_16260, partial [Oscillospiraceae bacterium]|nr:hypothetical protein [Oscillospiraceae bacterium]